MSHTVPASSRPITVPEFRSGKGRLEKLTVVTAYDFTGAKLVDEAGADAVLVGDSLGSVIQGHPNTLRVTVNQMAYHVECVARGTKRALLIADMPFLSYQSSPERAVLNAGKLLRAGAAAVKLEGGVRMVPAVEACLRAGIPVMGHVGMTPQSVHQFGGFKVQRDADRILEDAKALDQAGVFSMVIECVPSDIAAKVTAAVSVPTIGIGAGPKCDGQVLVFHDLLGLFDEYRPKFVKRYADLADSARKAIGAYCKEVRDGAFPGPEHEFS